MQVICNQLYHDVNQWKKLKMREHKKALAKSSLLHISFFSIFSRLHSQQDELLEDGLIIPVTG